ncbi:HlyD family type I secretion periplasmic adaptor subunit [Telmatospirillum siberiense]|uniref:Membrane fusion protein (MFP) family protein n=2 Tax=Telmatospirillum siberiense TaxID=382514 RepID=A0A2N3PLV1_9PROT|nr:HlyD family type I secretion periplasmic adaptor subunit [Telmatospirillum siberiense]
MNAGRLSAVLAGIHGRLADLASQWRRPGHEREFLPAALEIVETPPSPLGRTIMLTIVALVGSALLWSIFGRVDIIATAQGRIVPSGRVKTIQPFEIGVVKAIHVKDGQQVAAGDLLVELDLTTNQADQRRIARDLSRTRLDAARLKGLLGPAGGNVFDGLETEADPADLATARSEMMAQAAEQAAKLSAIDHQAEQRRAELEGVKATIAKLEASLPLISRRADLREEAARMEYGNQIDMLTARQLLVEQQRELVVQGHKKDETERAIAALAAQRRQAEEEYRRTLLADLAKAETQISEQDQDLVKATRKTMLQTLWAPVDGTVQQLAVHTLGGVVTPAQALMVIVPADAALEIEASLPNKDVGFVHAGEEAEIKVEAFTFTRYGLLHGHVAGVSRDSVGQDERAQSQRDAGDKPSAPVDPTTREPSYVAHIALAETAIETEQGATPLIPGMAVTAEIKTGRRRVISYLLSPLVRYRHEAMTER